MTPLSATELASVHGGFNAFTDWSTLTCDQLSTTQKEYKRVVDNRLGFHRWEFGRRLPHVNAAIAAKGCTSPQPATPTQ